MWCLAGRWNPERLAAHLPDHTELFDAQGQVRVEQLPSQLPDRVLVLLGREDWFPYQIDFRRGEADQAWNDDPQKWTKSSRSMVTMEMFEVQFGAKLNPLLFVYEPGDADPDDRTDEYVSRLEKR